VHLEGTYEMSERRACQVIQVDRKTIRYKARRLSDADLRLRLSELAASGGGSAIGVCTCCCAVKAMS
jgi:hypothetical protein